MYNQLAKGRTCRRGASVHSVLLRSGIRLSLDINSRLLHDGAKTFENTGTEEPSTITERNEEEIPPKGHHYGAGSYNSICCLLSASLVS